MNVRRSIAVAAVVVAAPALSSCGVSFGAPTDQVYNAAVGVDDRSGTVDVLNALVVSGQDGSGTVVAGLVNQDQQTADRLTGIGAGAAGEQDVTVDGPSTTTIPAAGMVSLADKGAYSITGQTIVPGRFVKLTFSFQNAKAITVDVPVLAAGDASGAYRNVPLPSDH